MRISSIGFFVDEYGWWGIEWRDEDHAEAQRLAGHDPCYYEKGPNHTYHGVWFEKPSVFDVINFLGKHIQERKLQGAA